MRDAGLQSAKAVEETVQALPLCREIEGQLLVLRSLVQATADTQFPHVSRLEPYDVFVYSAFQFRRAGPRGA
jgi:hypothetical protein